VSSQSRIVVLHSDPSPSEHPFPGSSGIDVLLPTKPTSSSPVADPRLLSAHRAMLPSTKERKDSLETDLIMGLARLKNLENAAEVEASLSPKELTAVLGTARDYIGCSIRRRADRRHKWPLIRLNGYRRAVYDRAHPG
jgi:hypothetical protein